MKTRNAVASVIVASMAMGAGGALAASVPGDNVSGGGQLLDTNTYTSEDLKISFGVWANVISAGVVEGELQLNIHNVSNPDLDRAKFHGTKIIAINFFNADSASCNAAFNMTVEGTLNGEPGYQVIMRGGDAGSPGNTNAAEPFDTARFEIRKIGVGLIYDTDHEYTRQSSCVGTARTGLDRGNLTIERG